MRAIVYERYGSPEVLRLQEVIKPTPKDNEVLIRIRATTVTSADCRLRSLTIPRGFGLISRLVFGITKPRKAVLGSKLAGDVESIGKSVRKFKVGDAVFAMSGFAMGAHAQYKCWPEDGAIALKPPRLFYDEAAALSFGGQTALDFFRRAKLQRGEKVLIKGASGSVGSAAVQLAKHFGAQKRKRHHHGGAGRLSGRLQAPHQLDCESRITNYKPRITPRPASYPIISKSIKPRSTSVDNNFARTLSPTLGG